MCHSRASHRTKCRSLSLANDFTLVYTGKNKLDFDSGSIKTYFARKGDRATPKRTRSGPGHHIGAKILHQCRGRTISLEALAVLPAAQTGRQGKKLHHFYIFSQNTALFFIFFTLKSLIHHAPPFPPPKEYVTIVAVMGVRSCSSASEK